MNLIEILHPDTLPELLEGAAELHEGKPALLSRATSDELSFEQMRDTAYLCASWLYEVHGIRPKDHVMLFASNSIDWVIAMFATSILGAVFVPVHPGVSLEQLHSIFERIHPKAVFVSWNQLPAAHATLASTVQTAPVIELNQIRSLLADYSPLLPFPAEFAPHSTDRAAIFWTSGTTGALKGVPLTHQNLTSNAVAFHHAVPVDESDRLFSVLPLAHIFEYTVGLLAPLFQGASITYPNPTDDFVSTFFDVSPTVLIAVPRLLEKFAAWGEVRLDHLAPLRLIISGGAALPIDLAKRFEAMRVEILQGYGLTETGPVISVNRSTANCLGTVGQPLEGVRVRVFDGELEVQGPSIAQTYLTATGETSALMPDGWFKTGDLVEIEDNFIRIVGRRKELIALSTGEKIAPLAIEQALESVSPVAQAMVVGEGRKHVAAIITLKNRRFMARPGGPTELKAAITAAVSHLPANHQVRTYIVLSHPFSFEAGELTPTFKLRRDLIAEKYADQIDDLYNRLQ